MKETKKCKICSKPFKTHKKNQIKCTLCTDFRKLNFKCLWCGNEYKKHLHHKEGVCKWCSMKIREDSKIIRKKLEE